MYSPKSEIYKLAIENAEKKLNAKFKKGILRGTEKIIQDEFFKILPAKVKKDDEVPLTSLGTRRLGDRENNRRTKMDIVVDGHGIELKVVRLPRLKPELTSGKALWDIGQLSGDYWSLAEAKNLKSGELLVLLHGPLVRDLGNAALRREFHNRLFVDFNTSLQFGEMKKPYKERWRKEQIECIKEMRIDLPFDDKTVSDMTVYRVKTVDSLALVRIEVRMRKDHTDF